MFKEKFEFFGEILQIDDFENVCHPNYVSTVFNYKNSKEDLMLIYAQYKDDILKMVAKNDQIRDIIMTDEKQIVRHDIDIEKTINFSKVTDDIFQKRSNLNYYEDRARTTIILEIAKLINCYGMEELKANHDLISKEIRLGIFTAKSDFFTTTEEAQKIQHRIEIDEKFGEEAIPYIENFELLKSRISSLKEFSDRPDEVMKLELLIQRLDSIQKMIDRNDRGVLTLLKQCYEGYEKMNKSMLLSRIKMPQEKIINRIDDDSVLLLHFIPDFKSNSDFQQEEFLLDSAYEYIRYFIEQKYGREFDPETDREEGSEMMQDFFDSKRYPVFFKYRIPIKNQYINDSLRPVITMPHTCLSCSIAKPGSVYPHLDRKIAIGFTSVPIEAIRTINRGYNNELDRFSFENNSVPISEVMGFLQAGWTNETLIDWTQVEPTYILVVKDTEELSEDVLKKAQDLSEYSELPIKIYDSYEIERSKCNLKQEEVSRTVAGAFSLSDLKVFARRKGKGNTIERIMKLGGKEHESDI